MTHKRKIFTILNKKLNDSSFLKKHMSLRPEKSENWLINTFDKISQNIETTYLKISNAAKRTGHSFQRTLARILPENKADLCNYTEITLP